ncbi:MAG: outer membrane lipoprotein LolB [Methylococcales bacterium]|nr:outer membrane lipoprotein LolB [Methylococcales bacterium]
MKGRFFTLLVLTGLLTSCADTLVKPVDQYQLIERNDLYNKAKWGFTGRFSYSDKSNSLTASINWKHLKEKDKVELAGPLGVGRTIVNIDGSNVEVNYDGKKIQFNGSVDDLITKYTGVSVPILSLKYWVIGLVDPEAAYDNVEDGFIQSGWHIKYQKMQIVNNEEMPKKIKVEKIDSKLKMIIDHWEM